MQALQHAAHLSESAAGTTPQKLAPAATAWVAAKREQLNSVMWNSAGIVRNQADLTVRPSLPAICTNIMQPLELWSVGRSLTEHVGLCRAVRCLHRCRIAISCTWCQPLIDQIGMSSK